MTQYWNKLRWTSYQYCWLYGINELITVVPPHDNLQWGEVCKVQHIYCANQMAGSDDMYMNHPTKCTGDSFRDLCCSVAAFRLDGEFVFLLNEKGNHFFAVRNRLKIITSRQQHLENNDVNWLVCLQSVKTCYRRGMNEWIKDQELFNYIWLVQ